jgi:hypothetical protein
MDRKNGGSDLKEQFNSGMTDYINRVGPGALGDTQQKQLFKTLRRPIIGIASAVKQNHELWDELIGGNGYLPCLALQDVTPSGNALAQVEHRIITYSLSCLSKKQAICIGRPPLSRDEIDAINNDLANLAEFPLGKLYFGFGKSPHNDRVVRHSNSPHPDNTSSENEEDESEHGVCPKDCEIYLTVQKDYDGTSATLISSNKRGDKLAALQIFANERVIKEILHYAAKLHCFTAVIYMTTSTLNDTEPFRLVSKNAMRVGNVMEVKPDFRLLSHFLGGHQDSGRTMSSEALRNRLFRPR